MPLTPLHFGLLAPINHLAKGKVSNVSFILVNLWIDAQSILFALTGEGAIEHGVNHSFFGATVLSLLVAMIGFRSDKWVYGAYLGGFTHILLDMLVHPEMQPFEPLMEGNPFYMGWMQPLSLVLLPLTIWFIVQSVSSIRGWIQRFPVASVRQTVQTFFSKIG